MRLPRLPVRWRKPATFRAYVEAWVASALESDPNRTAADIATAFPAPPWAPKVAPRHVRRALARMEADGRVVSAGVHGPHPLRRLYRLSTTTTTGGTGA